MDSISVIYILCTYVVIIIKEEVNLGAQEELEGERGVRNNTNTVFIYKVLKNIKCFNLKRSLASRKPTTTDTNTPSL